MIFIDGGLGIVVRRRDIGSNRAEEVDVGDFLVLLLFVSFRGVLNMHLNLEAVSHDTLTYFIRSSKIGPFPRLRG